MGKSPSYSLTGLTRGPTFGPIVSPSYLGPRCHLSPKGTMENPSSLALHFSAVGCLSQ